jgi:putative phosphoesterase
VRVAALFDVHGNLPALEAVLAELEREAVDAIVCGGDVVWGPMPAECLDRLVALGALFVRGNADRDALSGESEIDRFCGARLGEEQKALIAGWPLSLELDVSGVGRVLFCHATPRSDEEIVTRDTPDAVIAEALADIDADLVVVGHTHVQFDRRATGAARLVNAGSVGMPYEGREADARWAVIGPGVELRRTGYDVETAIESITETGLPDIDRIVGNALRGEVTADDSIRFFESLRTS